MTVQPFRIEVPDSEIDDLRSRLAHTRWPDEVDGADWDYGTNLAYLQSLLAYWHSGFDWRARAADLNRLDHFRAEVDGFGIHFVHQPGDGLAPMPLVLLNDSPAGLAAWMVEKFRRWSDCDGDVEARFSRDELLTNISIYWLTQTINSSMRLYYETLRDPAGWGQSRVPIAALMSSKDMFPTPREWAERSGPVDRWTAIDRGGHFLEWEEPQLVADDLRAFFQPLRERRSVSRSTSASR